MKFCNIAKFEIIWKIDEEFKLICQIIYKLCVFVIVYLSTHRQTHVNNRMLIYDRTPEEEQVFTMTVRIYIYVIDINLHGRRLTLQRHGKQQKLSSWSLWGINGKAICIVCLRRYMIFINPFTWSLSDAIISLLRTRENEESLRVQVQEKCDSCKLETTLLA